MPAPSLTAVAAPPRRPDGSVDIDAIVHALDPDQTSLLESARGLPHTGRWSWIVPHTGVRILATQAHATLVTPTRTYRLPGDPLDGLDDACETLGIDLTSPVGAHPPFAGGIVGGFSYDLSRVVEELPTWADDDRHHPLLDLVVADLVLAVDHDREEVVAVHRPDLLPRVGTPASDVAATLARLDPAAPPPERPTVQTSVDSTFTPGDYRKAVAKVLDHVAAGDVFQVNLTQRLTAPWSGTTWELYRALRTHSPAAYGASHPATWGGLASVSPETFLQVAGRRVRTRPIKGTRPRSDDPAVDARLAHALAASPKDRAENVMVVDMERNDLGRVCETGSVHVEGLLELERHPTVWHLVSTVAGQLRRGVTVGELLRATFPCGSVTGTPKVRAMEIIEELEPVRRSFYCGAIGFISSGAASLSVAIRTAELDRVLRVVDHGAGGGIVADSDPASEHAESVDKARAFALALGAELER